MLFTSRTPGPFEPHDWQTAWYLRMPGMIGVHVAVYRYPAGGAADTVPEGCRTTTSRRRRRPGGRRSPFIAVAAVPDGPGLRGASRSAAPSRRPALGDDKVRRLLPCTVRPTSPRTASVDELPVQLHVADPDPFESQTGRARLDLSDAQVGADVEIDRYPGAGHLYTDPGSPDRRGVRRRSIDLADARGPSSGRPATRQTGPDALRALSIAALKSATVMGGFWLPSGGERLAVHLEASGCPARRSCRRSRTSSSPRRRTCRP